MASYDLVQHRQRRDEAPDAGAVPEDRATEAAQFSEELERIYRSSQSPWASEARELEDFVHNAQFSKEQVQALKKRGQATTPINVMYPAMEQAVSMLTTKKPQFQATAREDSDVKTAKAVTDLLAWIWDRSDGNTHLKTAVYDYYVKGRGVLMAYVDPQADFGRGEVRVSSVDPLCVFPDPNSEDRLWRDASHIVVSRLFTREQIERMWPGARSLLPYARQSEATDEGITSTRMAQQNQQLGAHVQRDAHHDRYKVIERYTKVKVDYTHTKDTTTQTEEVHLRDELDAFKEEPAFFVQQGREERYVTRSDQVEELQALYEQAAPMEGEEGTRVWQAPPRGVDPRTGMPQQDPPLYLTPLTKGDLIELEVIQTRPVTLDRVQLVITIGGQEFYNGYLPTSEYPLIPLNNRHTRNPYPMSDIGFVKPMQEALNKLNIQIIANISSGTGPKVFVPRGGIDQAEAETKITRVGPEIIEYNAELGEPKIVVPNQIPSGLFHHFNVLTEMIERELGIFSTMQGDPNNAPDTYRGTLTLDEFGQRRIKSKLDDIESSLQLVARVCVDLMQHVYTEEKVLRLLQPNGTVKETVVNQLTYDDLSDPARRINDVTLGTYDVVVVTGSTLPSNRWAMSEYYQNLYQMGLIDQVEALKKSELVDVEGVLERSSYISRLEQLVEGQQEEIKKLQGDLQTANRASVNDRKRLEVAQFEKELYKTQESARQASQLYAQRLSDELQNQRKQDTESTPQQARPRQAA